MANLSLARIMYGATVEHSASLGGSAPALRPLSDPSVATGSEKPEAKSETLGELLHRAWTGLSSKR